VSNALKYAPGSPIEIVIMATERSDDKVDLLVEVIDHGSGVPVEEQELIFKKFVRGSTARSADVPGSGIGLATCSMMARLLGGSVGIDSHPGRGATFFLKIALPRATAASVPVTARKASPPGRHALVVDDQGYNQTVLAALIAELGYQVECA